MDIALRKNHKISFNVGDNASNQEVMLHLKILYLMFLCIYTYNLCKVRYDFILTKTAMLFYLYLLTNLNRMVKCWVAIFKFRGLSHSAFVCSYSYVDIEIPGFFK